MGHVVCEDLVDVGPGTGAELFDSGVHDRIGDVDHFGGGDHVGGCSTHAPNGTRQPPNRPTRAAWRMRLFVTY